MDEKRVAFVTGADRGLGLGITTHLLRRGWRVWAGRYIGEWAELDALRSEHGDALVPVPLDVSSAESVKKAAETVSGRESRVDLLINNAGVTSQTMYRSIRENPDYDEMHRMYDVNALGPLRVVEAFLPLVEASDLRRLCFVSSEAGSIGAMERTSWFGYCMSKAAVNMGVRILFNDLRPKGFSFRLYHPGWVRSYLSGEKNMEAKLEPIDAGEYAVNHFLDDGIDEETLTLVDYEGKRWPW